MFEKLWLVPCEEQKRKANLGTAVPVYIYRKYPAFSSNSPINFTKLPVALSRTYAIPIRLVYSGFILQITLTRRVLM